MQLTAYIFGGWYVSRWTGLLSLRTRDMKHVLAKRQNGSAEVDTHTHTANSVLPRNHYAVFIPAKSKRGREEGDGTENVINCRDVCRKLSWHFMTTYDVLWRFMSMEQRDGNCHKMSQIVETCRKLSWRLSQIVVTFFFPSPSRRPLLVFADYCLHPRKAHSKSYAWSTPCTILCLSFFEASKQALTNARLILGCGEVRV